jgi:hypothetical protein
MIAVLTAAPAATPLTGLSIAVTIAISVTAIVALGLVISSLRRSARFTLAAAAIASVGAVAVIVSALLVGGSLTQSPAANATITGVKHVGVPSIVTKLVGPQLPTL